MDRGMIHGWSRMVGLDRNIGKNGSPYPEGVGCALGCHCPLSGHPKCAGSLKTKDRSKARYTLQVQFAQILF